MRALTLQEQLEMSLTLQKLNDARLDIQAVYRLAMAGKIDGDIAVQIKELALSDLGDGSIGLTTLALRNY